MDNPRPEIKILRKEKDSCPCNENNMPLKQVPRNKGYCKIWVVQRNSATTFLKHLQRHVHKIRESNKISPPYCKDCDCLFETLASFKSSQKQKISPQSDRKDF